MSAQDGDGVDLIDLARVSVMLEAQFPSGDLALVARLLPDDVLEAESRRRARLRTSAPPSDLVALDELSVLGHFSRDDAAALPALDAAVEEDLRQLQPGDRVDVFLEDGRLVRSFVTTAPEDILRGSHALEGERAGWCVWVRGVRGTIELSRVRREGGWSA